MHNEQQKLSILTIESVSKSITNNLSNNDKENADSEIKSQPINAENIKSLITNNSPTKIFEDTNISCKI